MNADITVKGKSYKLIYSDKNGSLRRSITDGAGLPHTIKIGHMDAVNKATKLNTRRSMFRVDISHTDAGGVNPSPLTASITIVLEKGKGVYAPSSAALTLLTESAIQALASTSADASALDLDQAIFASEEQ